MGELLDRLSQGRYELERTVSRDTPDQVSKVPINYTMYRSYGWDETNDSVNIYALDFPIDIDSNSVKMQFPSPTEFVATISNYKIQIRPLNKAVDGTNSSFKIAQKNKRRITFVLKKCSSGKWHNLLQNNAHEKFKKSPIVNEDDEETSVDSTDPQASLTKLMKKMYDEGDDDMKRTILKSWHEAQNKQQSPV